MKKRLIWLLGLGLTLVIVPFIINVYSIFRLISLIIGILLIMISFCLKKKRNIFLIILVPLIILVVSLGLDTLLVYKIRYVPIFSLQVKSNKDVKFYLVQYSKINEALYFFTDKKLNKEKYEEVFSKNYTYSKKRVDILKDIKQIFKNKTYQNEDFVTLNNIRKAISNMDKDNDSSYTKVNIESINSPFYVSLTKDGTLIFLPAMFYLNYKNNEDTIKYILDISNIKEVLNQNENKLYDRIVVSKKDLPKQLQNEINKLNTDKSLVRKLIDYLKK